MLCMAAHAFGSDWAESRSQTFRFRRTLICLIPLRLDDAPIKGSLAQFFYIKWGPAHRTVRTRNFPMHLSGLPPGTTPRPNKTRGEYLK